MKKECIKCKYYKNYYKSTECYCEKGYCVMDKKNRRRNNERTREDFGRDRKSCDRV